MPSPAEQACRCPSPLRQQLASGLWPGAPNVHTAGYQQMNIHRRHTVLFLQHCVVCVCPQRVIVVPGNRLSQKPSGRVNGFKGQHSLIIMILWENRVTSAK